VARIDIRKVRIPRDPMSAIDQFDRSESTEHKQDNQDDQDRSANSIVHVRSPLTRNRCNPCADDDLCAGYDIDSVRRTHFTIWFGRHRRVS